MSEPSAYRETTNAQLLKAGIRNPEAVHAATRAIADAMAWNVRAYGTLAVDEDAGFFAAEAVKALEREYRLIPRENS